MRKEIKSKKTSITLLATIGSVVMIFIVAALQVSSNIKFADRTNRLLVEQIINIIQKSNEIESSGGNEDSVESIVNTMPVSDGINIYIAYGATDTICGTTDKVFMGKQLDQIGNLFQEKDLNKPCSKVINRNPVRCLLVEFDQYYIGISYNMTAINRGILGVLWLVVIYIAVTAGIITFLVKRYNLRLQENYEKNMEYVALDAINDALGSSGWNMKFNENGELESCKWSDKLRHMVGYANEKDFPNNFEAFSNIISEEYRENVLSEFWNTVDDYTGRKILDVQFYLNTNNRGQRWFKMAGSVVRRENGTPEYFYGVLIDLNIRKTTEEALKKANEERDNQIEILTSVSEVYNSMHLILLNENRVIEYASNERIRGKMDSELDAVSQMRVVMDALVYDEYKDIVFDFTDLTTIKERMKGKKTVYCDFLNRENRWIRASFIAINVLEDGSPDTVVFTTQIIDEEKRREESLLKKSRTDELTGFLNRRAYAEAINDIKHNGIEKSLVLISMDLNGLKTVNDSLGHVAGDELIVGASVCMRNCFGAYGKLYRVGGDEFMGILYATQDDMKKMVLDFDETTSKWSGKLLGNLTVSYGFVFADDYRDMTISDIEKLADERMYENKQNYYTHKGINRSGDSALMKNVLSMFGYTLQVDLLNDTFKLIGAERDYGQGMFATCSSFSDLAGSFVADGRVHESDLAEFREKINIEYIKNEFSKNNDLIRLVYRRYKEDKYVRTLVEIRKANKEDHEFAIIMIKDIESWMYNNDN